MKPSHPPRRLLWQGAALLAYGCLALALFFNVWSVEKLLAGDGKLEWPHSLHVWLIQMTAFLIGAGGLVLLANRTRLTHWLEAQSPGQQASTLFWLLVSIQALLGGAFMLTKQHPGFSDWGYLYDLFNLNQEFSIPTLYEVGILWLAAALAALIAFRSARYAAAGQSVVLTWAVTALTLTLMGFDELLSFHEQAGQLVSEDARASFAGYGYTWTLVGFPVAALLGVYFLIQFRRIFSGRPSQLVWLIMAGSLFLFGAVFVENFQMYLQKQHGHPETLSVYHLLEEMCEMLGIALAIRVFYRHARELLP